MPNVFSQYTKRRMALRHGDKNTFINEHYITIIKKKMNQHLRLLNNAAKAIEKRPIKMLGKRVKR